MNNIKAFILFFGTASFIFYLFTFFTVMMLNVLIEKRLPVKYVFGVSGIVLAVFYVLMFSGRGFHINFLWNLSFYLAVLIMYVLFLSVIIKLISLPFHFSPALNFIILTVSVIFIFVHGFYNAAKLNIKTIDITSEKISRPYKFVQISDVHLGTESLHFLENIIARINDISPDLVFITGDLLDDDNLKPEDIKLFSKMNPPAYFITGNHERYLQNTDDFFKDCKVVTTLDHNRRYDVFNEEITVYGLEWNRNNVMNKRSEQAVYFDNIETDRKKFNIFLNHEPALYDEAEAKGMDLMLSGHTHNGQIFPFWLFVRMRYKYMHGLYDIGNMKLYVTSGTGVWGPFMRVLTENEIVVLNLLPLK
ncbi:MAG TPA: metallophosphoesterase [Clostridiales bacterium]|nr:metallophosphoesterase [Clostridiales bacterium]HQP70176.1 metallophosphoesterase [Clostridiales bacterium]